ncbi:aspartyl-tRNA(Asn)/glutamyl-tRNA(Gln) amidotransferase subunit A [Actinomadura pelletieri DSM 43383]|uniref:Aspartyl-tRNA(Asn)/glutamyl-tRNA(Gln) amidotransferase subunit A n=1 Tax=Actinomadura pelletieri DSM 43383 TaxID=1120940 RepID=A0A495QBH3_9ACTN|nr:amidase [Actinomadura pelletieri]RKS69030.1 aspartyl-tRNA(Asn)/glutamyl-tRNA(Gln) amidotransferase subunit A [Actinomadura pelletieri DSM 43383]
MSDAADLTATELLAAYEAGTLSPVEATEAVLARIDRDDPALNAFCLVDEETTLDMARAATDRRRRGATLGPLDGVPVSIKDILLTRGWPTLRGSATTDLAGPWDEDSPAVARLREQGAVFVGKTTTPEFAWKGVTDNPVDGVTRNPWDVTRTPGGSSGGAAAAVAAGMAPLALGTDGGGSVRIPAAFTGIFTVKPTYGRIPHYPASAFGTLAHTGPMTNTVADAALLLDAVCGADGRDWSSLPPPDTSFTEAGPDDLTGLRVAFSPDLGYARVDPEIAASVAAAAEAFAELGAKVEQVDPGFGDPVEEFEVLWFAGAAKVVERLSPQDRARLDPGLREICEQGARYSAVEYLTATARRMELGRLMGVFHEQYDLLLTPTMPIAAFEAGVEVPPGSASRRWTSWTPFTYPFNMTQQPAASLPCGLTSEGLPIGLQVVGARHADALVMAACAAYEKARPWKRLTPKRPA